VVDGESNSFKDYHCPWVKVAFDEYNESVSASADKTREKVRKNQWV